MTSVRTSGFLIATALLVAACGPQGPVTLRHGAGTCYASSWDGDLTYDPASGETLFAAHGFHNGSPVAWAGRQSGRWSFGQVEIIDSRGTVVARTGGPASLIGGFEGDVFVTCDLETLP